MKQEVIWTWAAEADLQRFYAADEDRCEGSGIKVLTQVEKAADLLASFDGPQVACSGSSPDSPRP